MSFVGMGWQEILVIAVVAVMIFGPDKLPEMAGQAGKLLRDFRRMTTDMTGEFEKQTGVSVRDLKSNVDKEIAGLKSEMAGTTSGIQKELSSVGSSVSKTAKSVGKSATSSSTTKAGTAAKSTTTAAKSATTAKSAITAKPATTASASKQTSTAKKAVAEPVVVHASKHDPLAGVSFMDEEPVAATAKTDGRPSTNGSSSTAPTGTQADALMRSRARRQTAGYNQGPPSLN